MNFNRFNSYSMKARMGWVQRVLGIPVTFQRDKTTVRAITKFQKENGLSPNGQICSKTFDKLYSNGGSSISMK